MPETDGRSLLSVLGLNLSEVIKIASVAAVIYAQWTVMGKEIDDLQASGEVRRLLIVQMQKDLTAVEIEQARDDIRYENLREIVIELRRQAGLSTPSDRP